jgi:hypothetical protein
MRQTDDFRAARVFVELSILFPRSSDHARRLICKCDGEEESDTNLDKTIYVAFGASHVLMIRVASAMGPFVSGRPSIVPRGPVAVVAMDSSGKRGTTLDASALAIELSPGIEVELDLFQNPYGILWIATPPWRRERRELMAGNVDDFSVSFVSSGAVSVGVRRRARQTLRE